MIFIAFYNVGNCPPPTQQQPTHYLCRYELHHFNKYVWTGLQEHAITVYTVSSGPIYDTRY